jgi:hypothetical protein
MDALLLATVVACGIESHRLGLRRTELPVQSSEATLVADGDTRR